MVKLCRPHLVGATENFGLHFEMQDHYRGLRHDAAFIF
jgi:hypothetical protein